MCGWEQRIIYNTVRPDEFCVAVTIILEELRGCKRGLQLMSSRGEIFPLQDNLAPSLKESRPRWEIPGNSLIKVNKIFGILLVILVVLFNV